MNSEEKICNVPFIGTIINENLNIPYEIIDAYHRQVPQPTSHADISSSYSGKLQWYNAPYQVSIYGAFPLMSQWEMIEYKMQHCDDEFHKGYQRDVVFEHLKSFAKGFQYGFDTFLSEKINNKLALSFNEQSQAQRIMDFLSSPFNQFGFSEARGGSRHPFSNWYDDGIIGGYNYCAWLIIFTNHSLFEGYFNRNKTEKSENFSQNKSARPLGNIGMTSRYYENLRTLQNILSVRTAESFIKKANSEIISYAEDNYINPFQPASLSMKLIDEVKKFLEDNLFLPDEKRLLLKELLPHAKAFGAEHARNVKARIDLHEKLNKEMDKVPELQQTIKSLETIAAILFEEISNEFESLSDPAQPVIQKKTLPTVNFPDKIYQDVLNTLSDYGKDLEKKPSVFGGQDEEGLRDHFLTNLTGRYERTTASGETFNWQGKADILLKDDKGNNLFLCECKWWKGANALQTTIDQLLDRYTTWRDEKLAFIFFVGNKDFTHVLSQIIEQVKLHPCYNTFLNQKDESRFSFIFRQKIDIQRKVEVEFLFFHFYMPGSDE